MVMDRKQLAAYERKVKKTISDYSLISRGERVLVACSGGKDSTTLLYLLQRFGYDVEAIAIDLHIGEYSKENIENVKKFCKEHKIKLNLVDLREELGSSICFIRGGIQAKKKVSNCNICGAVKRWILNKKAKELRAAKLATGHNLSDESETVVMNLIKGNPELGLGMGPKTGLQSSSGFVQRIKPLYFCTNEETAAYSRAMGFPVVYEPCPCSVGVFRRRVRKGLGELEKSYPDIRINLVKNFMGLLPELKKRSASAGAVNECEQCGEPSRNRICRLCSLLLIQRQK
jgi:uncharacterized protein (TIGR00269 family)